MNDRFGDRVVTAAEMRKLESDFMEEHGAPSVLLMEHAALAVAEQVPTGTKVLILVGSGKNGGDAVAAGRLLLGRGFSCDFMTFYYGEGCSELALQWELLRSYGFPYEIFDMFSNQPDYANYDVILDGIFGIGLNRQVSADICKIFERINRMANRPKVIAIDVPSGVDATCGKVFDGALKADVTVTFSYPKSGLLLYPGRKYVGRLVTANIGLPENDDIPEYVTFDSIEDCDIPAREMDGNKGSFGRISLVAGSEGMPGAPCLCAKAMYRSGVGLVKVFSTKDALQALSFYCPEAIGACTDDIPDDLNLFEGFHNVIVIGPGLGTDERAEHLLDLAIQYGKRLVIDADALNILAARLDRISMDTERRLVLLNDWLPAETIITPHPGEMSRLLNIPVAELKADPIVWTKMIRKYCEFIWVWKDSCTIVVSERGFYLNRSGNEAMGTAGSGDVLSGICGAMAAADWSMAQAASAAVFVHGLAGDLCKDKLGSHATMAGDIVDAIGPALKGEVSIR